MAEPKSSPQPAATDDGSDRVWKSLADPTRRAVLDYLRGGTRTTTEIVERFPEMSRFGVMKHWDNNRNEKLRRSFVHAMRGRGGDTFHACPGENSSSHLPKCRKRSSPRTSTAGQGLPSELAATGLTEGGQ